jgi:hypothetical protein
MVTKNIFENSNEVKLQRILSTLKDIHGVELILDENELESLELQKQRSEILKNSIVSESKNNTYNTNNLYNKHILIMEAIQLFLTEIAPKRTKKIKVKENAIPSMPPSSTTKPNTTSTQTNSRNQTNAPGTITVKKGNDTKTIQAAQLAGMQSQGYQIVGDNDSVVTKEDNNLNTDDSTSDKTKIKINMTPELQMLMKKYNVLEGKSKQVKKNVLMPPKNVKKVVKENKVKMTPELQMLMKKYGITENKKLKESIGEEKDYQASMARAELYRNTKYCMEMMKLIRPEDNIQPWILSSLVKASDYLDQVSQYMEYYTNFEPEQLQEGKNVNLEKHSMRTENTGETVREILLSIIENSKKLFNVIQPGNKLEGWIAMKLTSASNSISSAKHYIDYMQFEKHAYDHIHDMENPISEKFNMRRKVSKLKENNSISQMLMKMMVTEDQDLAQAQALLAAKSLSDDLLSMAEKISKMSIDDLIPLVDSIRDQFGPEAADAYNQMMKQSLEQLLNSTTEAKTTSDNAITQLQGGQIPGQNSDGSVGGGSSNEPPNPDDLNNIGQNNEMPQEPQVPLGRERKEDNLAEAWKEKMNTAKKDKGMWDGYTLEDLKSKKEKLMAKKERTAAEQKKVKELNFAIRAKQKDKWGKVDENNSTKSKFTSPELREIKQFLNDKITYSNLSPKLCKKIDDVYPECAKSKQHNKASCVYDRLAKAMHSGEFGPGFYEKLRESKKVEKKPFNKAEYFAKKKKNAEEKSTTKNKVDESAPPGKKAEKFIKDSKESFRKKYGKKWQEVLYATAWKKFGKKDESYINAKMQLENNKNLLSKLQEAFNKHKKEYALIIKEGKVDDPLNIGYGLDGELILKQINEVKTTINKLNNIIKKEIKNGAIGLILAEQNADNINTILAAKKNAPWGVAWKTTTGEGKAKFFETEQDRTYWMNLKTLNESKLINPEHFDMQISNLSNNKD